eukprot:scaffold329953_cov53-Tisochrysis_lutea.AAC.5
MALSLSASEGTADRNETPPGVAAGSSSGVGCDPCEWPADWPPAHDMLLPAVAMACRGWRCSATPATECCCINSTADRGPEFLGPGSSGGCVGFMVAMALRCCDGTAIGPPAGMWTSLVPPSERGMISDGRMASRSATWASPADCEAQRTRGGNVGGARGVGAPVRARAGQCTEAGTCVEWPTSPRRSSARWRRRPGGPSGSEVGGGWRGRLAEDQGRTRNRTAGRDRPAARLLEVEWEDAHARVVDAVDRRALHIEDGEAATGWGAAEGLHPPRLCGALVRQWKARKRGAHVPFVLPSQ